MGKAKGSSSVGSRQAGALLGVGFPPSNDRLCAAGRNGGPYHPRPERIRFVVVPKQGSVHELGEEFGLTISASVRDPWTIEGSVLLGFASLGIFEVHDYRLLAVVSRKCIVANKPTMVLVRRNNLSPVVADEIATDTEAGRWTDGARIHAVANGAEAEVNRRYYHVLDSTSRRVKVAYSVLGA